MKTTQQNAGALLSESSQMFAFTEPIWLYKLCVMLPQKNKEFDSNSIISAEEVLGKLVELGLQGFRTMSSSSVATNDKGLKFQHHSVAAIYISLE